MVRDLGVSEHRACRVLGQKRATQRYAPQPRSDEAPLTARIVELAGTYGRYGYRRVTAMLRSESWRVNHKRVERIWRQAGLRVPGRQPKRGRVWLNDGSCVRLRPEHKDHVWAYDFVQDRTHDGRSFKMLTVVDEYTREPEWYKQIQLQPMSSMFVLKLQPSFDAGVSGRCFSVQLFVCDHAEQPGFTRLDDQDCTQIKDVVNEEYQNDPVLPRPEDVSLGP